MAEHDNTENQAEGDGGTALRGNLWYGLLRVLMALNLLVILGISGSLVNAGVTGGLIGRLADSATIQQEARSLVLAGVVGGLTILTISLWLTLSVSNSSKVSDRRRSFAYLAITSGFLGGILTSFLNGMYVGLVVGVLELLVVRMAWRTRYPQSPRLPHLRNIALVALLLPVMSFATGMPGVAVGVLAGGATTNPVARQAENSRAKAEAEMLWRQVSATAALEGKDSPTVELIATAAGEVGVGYDTVSGAVNNSSYYVCITGISEQPCQG